MSEELAQLVSELPAVFEQVLAALPSILPAIAYYQSFVQYTTQRCVAMVTMTIELFHMTSSPSSTRRKIENHHPVDVEENSIVSIAILANIERRHLYVMLLVCVENV